MTTTVRFVPRLTTVRFPLCGSVVTANQFAGLMAAYNASLQEFQNSGDAFTALGAGKEYIAAQGNTEVAQGTKMITYAV